MNPVTGLIASTETSTGNRRVRQLTANITTVHVVADNGRILQPCHPARARELIRKQRAKCICSLTYTIQLLSLASPQAQRQAEQEYP